MEMISLEQELQRNAYPGRGIILGKSADGTKSGSGLFYHGQK